jgi:large subunit ribosomal protein L1
MAKISKKQKEARSKVDPKKIYNLKEASALVKQITNTKFDASIDLAIRLGVDPKKS